MINTLNGPEQKQDVEQYANLTLVDKPIVKNCMCGLGEMLTSKSNRGVRGDFYFYLATLTDKWVELKIQG